MHCRAYCLQERDLWELKQSNLKGITALPVSEDMMKWEAEIEGLQDSVCHGLVFRLTVDFTSEYNSVPPVVRFVPPIPFHPNVDPYTGKPCIDFLDNRVKWNGRYTLSSILLAIQVMLSNPELENPVNFEAAQKLIEDESMHTTKKQRRFHGPLQSQYDSLELPEDSQEFIKSIKTVSFIDYYETWSNIATSKATEYYRTPLLKNPDFLTRYYKWRKIDLQFPKEWNLKYAAIKSRFSKENRIPHTVSHLVGRYLCPTPDEVSSESQPGIDIVPKIYETERWKNGDSLYENDSYEPWEEEVEDLVAWTSTLNTDTLED
ncbi:ubiquitin-conjugating enzyme E2 U [Tupaia chinensis]|uniref:ubiquitin-conjugating enzyme E2 U n=1 Tax=Tupaia chinensis TaxID=246437 RepID=UPI0003C8F186|nr:ubiquitin-conjugating enzyme E2 U [Tupaia chinensis]